MISSQSDDAWYRRFRWCLRLSSRDHLGRSACAIIGDSFYGILSKCPISVVYSVVVAERTRCAFSSCFKAIVLSKKVKGASPQSTIVAQLLKEFSPTTSDLFSFERAHDKLV